MQESEGVFEVLYIGLLLVAGIGALLLVMGLFGRKQKPKDGGRGVKPGRHGAGGVYGQPHTTSRYPAAPFAETITGDYAACLVIPARHTELITELQERAERGETLEERHAEALKNTALRFWYGRTGQWQEFEPLARIASNPEQKSFSPSLDFVLCLFYLYGPNGDFEAGTIGRRYDGILALASNIREMKISKQISADDLSGLHLTSL